MRRTDDLLVPHSTSPTAGATGARSLAAVAALLGILCGCGPEDVSDLDRPAIAVSVREGGGFCSSVHAVDGNGRTWISGGCGEDATGLEQRDRVVDAAERESLHAMMDEVLALSDDPECAVTSPSGRALRFIRTTEGGSEAQVRQCEPSIPLVATQLAERLIELTSPPDASDAGADASP